MNIISIANYRPFQKLHPLSLLAQVNSRQATGCLRVSDGSASWWIYLVDGKLIYASNSNDPFKRLDQHLRQLSHQVPTLVSAVRVQVRLMFDRSNDIDWMDAPDYRAICWLVEQQYLTMAQATTLIENLAKDVLESFLQVREGVHELADCTLLNDVRPLCQLELRPLVEHCQQELRRRAVSRTVRPESAPPAKPAVTPSPAQPLNPSTDSPSEPLTSAPSPLASTATPSAQQNSYGTELATPGLEAESFQATELRTDDDQSTTGQAVQVPPSPGMLGGSTEAVAQGTGKKVYTIACVDDSPTVLNIMQSFLDDKSFSVVVINDPIKALMQIVRSKPHMILLDITMPNLDGYELCSLLRRHPSFRKTPIIMVTGNKGLVDRAKAKLVRASGYLTKPFTQAELLKVVFKHLT
ncbi:MAG: response regulator [Synechococcales bacterium]|nr:response regulator [Synechococcales bacterium]